MKLKAESCLLIAGLLVCAGCTTPVVPARDATSSLIARPDFKSAATAAPGWVGAALAQITQYETDLARCQTK
jgi:hypothetical protein